MNEHASTIHANTDEFTPTLVHARESQANGTQASQDLPDAWKPQAAKSVQTIPELNRQSLLQDAWAMFRAGVYKTFAEALKASWRRIRIVSALKGGIAYFSYLKASGEVRNAIGTLRNGNFTYDPQTDGVTPPKPHVVRYWDIQCRGWRSFRLDRLITAA